MNPFWAKVQRCVSCADTRREWPGHDCAPFWVNQLPLCRRTCGRKSRTWLQISRRSVKHTVNRSKNRRKDAFLCLVSCSPTRDENTQHTCGSTWGGRRGWALPCSSRSLHVPLASIPLAIRNPSKAAARRLRAQRQRRQQQHRRQASRLTPSLRTAHRPLRSSLRAPSRHQLHPVRMPAAQRCQLHRA
jgi:hypothetical protein